MSFGSISISESFSKSCTVVPLVSLTIDDTFAVDTRTQKIITVSFNRVQPNDGIDGGSDSTRWNNGYWVNRVTAAMNRWQCRTNGFRLYFEPSDDNPYVAPFDVNGYVKNMSIQYSADDPSRVTGSFEFHVGTMYVNTNRSNPSEVTRQDAFSILLSDSNRSAYYPLLNDDLNCVKSYTLSGGIENPFEYVTLKIPKNRLTSVLPNMVDENGSVDIVAGKNALVINAVGQSTMTVTKCKLSSNIYTITAYCDAEKLRGYSISSAESNTPMGWIEHILDGSFGGVVFKGDSLIMCHESSADSIGSLEFREGTNVWYILQVCAMCIGCRVFFANNKAYVVDTRMSNTEGAMQECGLIDLYTRSEGDMMYARVTGSVSLGDEGTDTIVNSLTINCTTNDPEADDPSELFTSSKTFTTNQASVNAYGKRSGGTLYMSELMETSEYVTEEENPEAGQPDPDTGEPQGDMIEVTHDAISQASVFASNYISYRAEPQQSIEFTVKEIEYRNGGACWVPCFDVAARATRIQDTADDVSITNSSDLGSGVLPQKLTLSTFSRSYPEGTTTYTWGVMASIDLSTSTSQIVTNLDNVQ